MSNQSMIEAIKSECLYRIMNRPIEEVQVEIELLQEMGVDIDAYIWSQIHPEQPEEDPEDPQVV